MTGDTTSSLTASAKLSLIAIKFGPIRWPSVRAGSSSDTEAKNFFANLLWSTCFSKTRPDALAASIYFAAGSGKLNFSVVAHGIG